ncbi:unnamed protein product (macronuclear) [Paramecium tetraurelia]|uniref:Transmembrane protein n=1 Tax=Paramecium tetraurelia TaxID=5888 RepID=A0BJG1_PARTE|nr:uncharacterized protein GSPATT00029305001 [Paramecium tetraurelia]CAK58678.1 unnamed protein product [Paramecium tetraurelia]|eukprot:XP_001426076.1 hypothetical protein (macronuclear) [Paramecium tetraurelia strain d4-2]
MKVIVQFLKFYRNYKSDESSLINNTNCHYYKMQQMNKIVYFHSRILYILEYYYSESRIIIKFTCFQSSFNIFCDVIQFMIGYLQIRIELGLDQIIKLLQLQLILLSSSVITLFYIYDRELNKQKISILFSICNISIFMIETRIIGNSQYFTIAAAFFLIFKYYIKKQDDSHIPQINILNSQVQNNTGKQDQEMEQYPQQLPAIQSIYECNQNITPKQIPNSNEINIGRQVTTERSKQPIKQESLMGFLGDKRQSYAKNSISGFPQRQQTNQLNQVNFNVIKFQDDCGEIKFGLLKTLKSINFDQLGKEIEIIYQNDKTLTRLLSNIEKKSGPRMQILYESQQAPNPVINENLRGVIIMTQFKLMNKRRQHGRRFFKYQPVR